jgi:diaphanous 1
MEPSEGTLKALQEQDEDDGDDEHTAKATGVIRSPQPQRPVTPPSLTDARERSSSVTQNRLSSMFEGWLRSSSPTSSSDSPNRNIAVRGTSNRVSISEPKLLEQQTGASVFSNSTGEVSDEDFDSAFEAMLVCKSYLYARVFGY